MGTSPQERPPTPGDPVARSQHHDGVGPTDDAGPTPDWEEYAGFFVFFDHAQIARDQQWRTRVWDTRALVEGEFLGTSPAPWISFILGRVDLPPAASDSRTESFEVRRASVETLSTPEGPQTWLQADVTIDVKRDGALEAAIGSALLAACLPEIGQPQ